MHGVTFRPLEGCSVYCIGFAESTSTRVLGGDSVFINRGATLRESAIEVQPLAVGAAPELSNLRLACKDVQPTMMYYWIVKHDDSEAQNIISYRKELNALRAHHIVVESLSPLSSGASFALGHEIKTERTWRDLNDTLVTYLQSQRVHDGKEQSALGVHLGTNMSPVRSRRAL